MTTPEGVTAEFNRNLLVRINRELDANFDLAAFRHEARYFEDPPRIEMHLVCERPVSVQMAGESFELEAGESLHTETSHKYSIAGFTALAAEADWVVSHQWHDAESRFAVLMMHPPLTEPISTALIIGSGYNPQLVSNPHRSPAL